MRMKATREHRIPLCRRALEILDAARALGDGGNAIVFPSGNGKPLDEKRMHRALQWGRIGAVPHGFRSSFRDWAAEETDHPREVVEAALVHVVRNKNKVEDAYARSGLFERRRLMNDWEAYVAGTHAERPPIVKPADTDPPEPQHLDPSTSPGPIPDAPVDHTPAPSESGAVETRSRRAAEDPGGVYRSSSTVAAITASRTVPVSGGSAAASALRASLSMPW